MQATFEQIQANYRRCVEGSAPKPLAFARMVKEQVGLTDARGEFYRRPDGFPMLKKDRAKACADYPLDLLAEAMIGREWRRVLSEGGSRWLSEEAVAPIGPSNFVNVSAWTATVGGLVQGTILEGYETTTEFDVADLFPTRPVIFWQGGERYVGILGPSKPAPKVGPGEDHPDARLDAMWVEPAQMSKYGLKITVAKETAVVDITGGNILQQARDLGTSLRYRENELALDIITGQTNNFKLGVNQDSAATGYNTYGATVPAGPNGATATLANSITNPMTDPLTTFNASQESLLAYRHPVTGLPMPMANRLTTILIPSNLQWFATYLTTAAQITLGSQPAAPGPGALGGTFPTGWTTANNPFAGLFKQVRVSQWLYIRHTASTTQTDPDITAGLGLSTANSRRWYRLDPERFAARRLAWDVQVTELAPNSYTMAAQNLVFGAVANMGVAFQVLNPWAIQRSVVA
jgi:hypothetical protein